MFMTSASGAVRKGMTSLFFCWMNEEKPRVLCCYASRALVAGSWHVQGGRNTSGFESKCWHLRNLSYWWGVQSILVRLCCHRGERVLLCVFGVFGRRVGGVRMWNGVRVRGGHFLHEKFNHFLSHKQCSDSLSLPVAVESVSTAAVNAQLVIYHLKKLFHSRWTPTSTIKRRQLIKG